MEIQQNFSFLHGFLVNFACVLLVVAEPFVLAGARRAVLCTHCTESPRTCQRGHRTRLHTWPSYLSELVTKLFPDV